MRDLSPVYARKKWYVMQTKPRSESRAITHLRRRAADVETFLPTIEVVRKRESRRLTFFEPLFPSYVFLRMDVTPTSWNAVRWTPGVRRILGDGEWPIEVPDDAIDMIAERVAPLGFIRLGLGLTPGTIVRVRNGAFAGLEGIFERPTNSEGRVRVLLDLLGVKTPLEIDALDVERL